MSKQFKRLREVVSALRDPKTGCPWDLEQTHKSLRPYAIEEAYEVVEAINADDSTELCGELGDLLLQVMIHSQIAEERGAFSIEDVLEKVADKMVRRHPHVFGDVKVKNSNDVLKNWEQIKLAENKDKKTHSSILESIPKNLPALLRAQRVGEKASKTSFDWSSADAVMEKVDEELDELKQALNDKENIEALEHELGDLLFSLGQLARWLKLSAEDSLHTCCHRFLERFSKLEARLDRPISEFSADELEDAWQKVKTES